MSGDEFHERIGRQLVERVHGETEGFEGSFEDVGRGLLHAGGPDAGAEAYEAVDEHVARTEILPRIDDDLIEEHAENPIGRHGDDLQRVVEYFRRQPTEGKYVIVETERNETWCLGRLSGERGVPVEVTDDCYGSPEDAEHAVFERRVEAFRERFGDGEER